MDNFLYNSIIIQMTANNLLDSNVDRSLGRCCLRKRSIEHFGKFQFDSRIQEISKLVVATI